MQDHIPGRAVFCSRCDDELEASALARVELLQVLRRDSEVEMLAGAVNGIAALPSGSSCRASVRLRRHAARRRGAGGLRHLRRGLHLRRRGRLAAPLTQRQPIDCDAVSAATYPAGRVTINDYD